MKQEYKSGRLLYRTERHDRRVLQPRHRGKRNRIRFEDDDMCDAPPAPPPSPAPSQTSTSDEPTVTLHGKENYSAWANASRDFLRERYLLNHIEDTARPKYAPRNYKHTEYMRLRREGRTESSGLVGKEQKTFEYGAWKEANHTVMDHIRNSCHDDVKRHIPREYTTAAQIWRYLRDQHSNMFSEKVKAEEELTNIPFQDMDADEFCQIFQRRLEYATAAGLELSDVIKSILFLKAVKNGARYAEQESFRLWAKKMAEQSGNVRTPQVEHLISEFKKNFIGELNMYG